MTQVCYHKVTREVAPPLTPHPNPVAPVVPFSPFNLTYYQSYFDVDTKTVLNRCFQACIPRGGFINDVCEERIDLYGALGRPCWRLRPAC